MQAFDQYEVGNISDDECQTFVTVIQGDGNDGIFIGGGTSSPLFYNRHTGENLDTDACFDSTIAFILKQDDESDNDYGVEWSRFFGGPDNTTYSQVNTISHGY